VSYSQITSSYDPLDWFPEECYWSGLDEAPSGTREYYRAASSYPFETSTLEGGGWSAPPPVALPAENPRYPLYRRHGGPGGRVWTARNISPPTRIRFPYCTAPSYPGHRKTQYTIPKFCLSIENTERMFILWRELLRTHRGVWCVYQLF
jgi:hypothetical protein